MLNEQQRKTLLRVAREAVGAAAAGEPYAPTCDDPNLREPGAAFVTLRNRGELRGCIGVTESEAPLIETVARMARAAARDDPRFIPVQPSEVPSLTVEISVLSAPEPVANTNEIEVGTHGLMIQRGTQRGLLLPQVPVEWGWDREQFLDQTCVKAGLPPGCWRRDARIYAFTAEVFGEED